MNTYIAAEGLAALVILILIYANIFEIKQQTRKRRIFTRLLIANETVVAADAITWMHLPWDKMPAVLGGLITVTYVAPAVMQILFCIYLFEHLSMKAPVSKKPFRYVIIYSVAEGFLTLLLLISGTLFTIQDGKYYPASMEGLYYIAYGISLLILLVLVLSNSRKMSRHDLFAALSFCVVPLLSLVVTLMTGLNVSIMLMSVTTLLIYVMLQSENESDLYGRANLDEMTGLFNRRAYEEAIRQLEEPPMMPNLVYASVDVNELKAVNDNLGHIAGDELICGAAQCLKETFGPYGSVFRTGGDEFTAIFSADEAKLQQLTADLWKAAGRWKGTAVDTLSLSVGYASKKEFPEHSLVEMAKIADKRMYDEKSHFYISKGIDRGGQSEAYKVLCSLYTKVLKINLTDNSYLIVNMNADEQRKEKGFSNGIGEWLEGFGRSGQVHPDDLENYLSRTNLDYMRRYFKRKKASLAITYRRKFNSAFKQVMMEIIPANDYTDENQSLYLYVKNIDI